MKKSLWFIIVVALTVCEFSARADETNLTGQITVAAAADLKFALDEIATDFQKTHSNVTVKTTYGSSGTLFAQIDNGAPFDLFLSADIEFPRKLIERQRAELDSLFSYAVGRLVVWVANASPIDVQKLGIQALLDPSVKKIAIANPEHAPYGRAAVAAMKKLGVYDQVAKSFVMGENVAQAAQFVESGAADIGVIALSLACSPKMKNDGRYWEVPLDAFPRLEQGGVVVSGTKQPALARAFRETLIGTRGREVLKRYGFILPERSD